MPKQKQILQSAINIFVKYGFHGSTLMKIASVAKVSKTTIHYYYRSKEKLYANVLEKICQLIVNEKSACYVWFLLTEFRNNRKMLMSVLNEIGDDVCLLEIKKYINNNINKFISDISF